MTAGAELETYYEDRGRRAREWRAAGGKVIGYFCCFVPEEIISAFDMLPFRIQGRPGDPIDQADAFIEPMACPFARSCFNLALKGEYDFLDGFVVPHSCDTVERLFPIWRHNKPASFNHLLKVPHMRGPGSEEFFRRELGYFIQSLEEWSGRKLDPERLREAVRLSNQRRAALRELYGLRQADPPLVSGAEVTRIVVAGMGLPEIVAGIHAAIAGRVVNLVRTLGLQKDIVVTGGGAEDIGLVRAVSEALGLPVQVPEPPRLTAALGAACLAGENQP